MFASSWDFLPKSGFLMLTIPEVPVLPRGLGRGR